MADADPHTIALLREDFTELPVGGLTEVQLLDWLAEQVDYLLRNRREYLMSLCYTLDLNEREVADALHPSAPRPANVGLAHLLYVRQRKRARTKQNIRAEPLDDENAW